MKYVFKPGDRLTVKIGTEYINLKVVADDICIPPCHNCKNCFFDTLDLEVTCETQVCSLRGNRYHYELDNPTPTEHERH